MEKEKTFFNVYKILRPNIGNTPYYTLAFATLSWTFSLFFSNLSMPCFGLISGLHWTYYLALIILFLTFCISLSDVNTFKKLIFLEIILLIVLLYATPSLLERTPRITSGFKFYGHTEYILRNGMISQEKLWYHAWPGFFYLFSVVFTLLPELNYFFLITYYPFIWSLFTLPFLYTLFSYVSRKKTISLLAIWVFYTLNWVGQNYFSPQSLAIILLLLLSMFLARIACNGIIEEKKSVIIISLLLITLLLTHILTTLFSLILISIVFLSKVFKKGSLKNTKIVGFIFVALIMLSVFLWLLWGGEVWFSENIGSLESIIRRLSEFRFSAVSELQSRSFSGNLEHNIIILARILISGIFWMSSFYAFIYIIYKRIYVKFESYYISYIFSILIFSIILLQIWQNREAFQRIFLLSLPVFCIVLAKFVYYHRIHNHLIIILLFLSPLTLIAFWGNENVDYVPPANFDAGRYLGKYPIDDYVVLGDYTSEYLGLDLKNFESLHFLPLDSYTWNGSLLIPTIEDEIYFKDYPQIIVITQNIKEGYLLFRNDNDTFRQLEENLTLSKMYQNVFKNEFATIFVSITKY